MKTYSEAETKDLILKFAIENFGKPITVGKIKNEILSHLEEDEIELLIKRINNCVDEIADIRISKHQCIIIATNITRRFLDQGGFMLVESDSNAIEKKLIEKEKLELEKTLLDIRFKKWQLKTYWWFFGFALLGSGLSIYNFFHERNNQKSDATIIKQTEREKSKVKGINLKSDSIKINATK